MAKIRIRARVRRNSASLIPARVRRALHLKAGDAVTITFETAPVMEWAAHDVSEYDPLNAIIGIAKGKPRYDSTNHDTPLYKNAPASESAEYHPLNAIIGMVSGGHKDVAENHDRYLYQTDPH